MGGAESKHRAKPVKYSSQIADRPSVPGKPQLVPSDRHSAEPDVVTIRWEPPLYDGGSRITGYLVEHRRTGSPHWVRSSPTLVRVPELTLSGLEPGWRYQFRVSAQNALGLSEPGDLSDLLTVTLQRTAASAPYFVKELKDTVALENEKAELTVQIRGTPTPTIAWFKDGVEIFSSRSYRVVTDNEISTLVIHQASLSDEGEIKCSATNRVGYTVTRAKLTLEAPPSIRLPRQYEEGLLFEKDEVIRLKVSVAGRPVPEVSWLLNGELVPGGGRYEAGHSERYATLRVGEARRSDRGEYQVRAVNRLGEDVASFLVTVADRPMPPGRAKVVMTLGRSVTLSWSTPEDDGGCKIGNYIVEYYRLGWNMWLKAATCRQLTTTLGDLIEGSEYKFRVKAENPYGVSDPSPESDVVFIPDPKRGLLEPPEHGPTYIEETMDIWLEDKKRPLSASPTIDEQYGERKTKKKRGPLAPPQSQKPDTTRDLGYTEKHSMMSEDSMSPPPTPENFRPVKPKRRGKGDMFDINTELQEEKELTRILEERRKVEEFKRFEEMRKADENRKAKQIKKDEETKMTESKKKSELITKKEQKDSKSSMPQSIEQNPLHGSSELMLVLVPHSRATTEERETSKRELFESSMALEGDDIAPPMSLSAPELGSGGPLEQPPVRASFSSTELLHDRAMARFYQEMAKEEAETSMRRQNSLQRRRSFERRSSSRGKDIPEKSESLQDIVSAMRSISDTIDNSKMLPTSTENTPQGKILTKISTHTIQSEKKSFSRDSMDSMASTEEQRKLRLVQQTSEEDMEYEDSSFDEDEEDEYDEEEEEPVTEDEAMLEEDIEEEELEEEEEFSNYEKTGSLYTSESEEEMRYSMDEVTYQPKNVNTKYNEDTMISEYEGRGPLILGSVQQTPGPSLVSSAPAPNNCISKEVKLKPILKKPLAEKPTGKDTEHSDTNQGKINLEDQKTKPIESQEKRFEPNFSPIMPKPILKVREPSQERLSPINHRGLPLLSEDESEGNVESTSRTNLDELSDYETGNKKKQVRIEEPQEVSSRAPSEKRDTELPIIPVEVPARPRSESVSNEADTTKVLIDHYSDIVREFGSGRRKPKKVLYLNYEALKAAAEKEEEGAAGVDVPDIVLNAPEKTPEPEAKLDEQAKEEPIYSKEEIKELVKTENPTVYVEPYIEDRLARLETPRESTNKVSLTQPLEKKSPRSPRTKSRSPARPKVKKDISPEKTEVIRTPSPVSLPKIYTSTEKKVHSYFDFLMDFSLFILACWLYLFKDERLSIPVLGLMIYRQAHEAFRRKMEALRNKLPRRILFWRRQ